MTEKGRKYRISILDQKKSSLLLGIIRKSSQNQKFFVFKPECNSCEVRIGTT